MSKTTRRRGYKYPYRSDTEKVKDKDVPKISRNHRRNRMKKSTRKLLKLRLFEAWDVPNSDKLGRTIW